ncbi:Spy/CpxP family protein refolding chaperone [Winogradskyella sp.]|uniref:Spy/CpxP family protein refolding chaperone n=1 Tax=Winogradskyella sp. TaxID=1883156 RepID=UPI0025ECC3CE|nr:Spy/CpxP family protein refolding chaperone [Winogradskyella sp.]
MKKLIVIALALFTLNGVAQEKRKRASERHDKMELRKDMTPKDIADLKAKKMTLHLDLTDTQQQKVHQLILKQAEVNQSLRKEHKADGEKREKPSKEERVKMQNHKLDQLIAMKRELKTILTPEQYAKFEKMEPKKHGKHGKRSKKQ